MNNKVDITNEINDVDHLRTNQSIHNVPANKEWFNSVYTHDKAIHKNLPVKNKLAYDIINAYFSMVEEKKRKSKRLSDLLRKSTSKKVFISKMEIKQNNDKAIITIYMFDRERQYVNKQILLDMDVFKTVIRNNIDIKDSQKIWQIKKVGKAGKILNIENPDTKFSKNKLKGYTSLNYKLRKQSTNIFFNKRYQDNNVNKNLIFLRKLFTLNNVNNKYNFSSYFIFNYLVWVLSIFNFKPKIFNNTIKLINLKDSNELDKPYMTNIINNYINVLNKKNSSDKKVLKKYSKNELTLIKCLVPTRNKDTINNMINIKNIKIINVILLKFVNIILKKFANNVYVRNKIMNASLKTFNKLYLSKYNLIIKNIFNKEFNIVSLLNEWSFIKKKTSNFLPYLKALLEKIYENYIELNLVNLKYIQLNSSLLINATAIKLKKRKARLLTVLKRSIKLARMPKSYKILNIHNAKELDRNESNTNNLFINKINNYKGIDINNLYNSKLFTELFTVLFGANVNVKHKDIYNKKNNETNKTKEKLLSNNINSNINDIKHKWLTGIKLEANGRLTKRFTASRALHKIKIKGSLQNYQHLKKRIKFYQKPNVVLLRGLVRPNIQHSFITSTRRVGAFGLKSWISNN